MFPIIEDPKRKDKIKDYIDYLDRTRRTTGKSRYETHQLALSKETAKYYTLTEKEISMLDDIFKNEKLNNENDKQEQSVEEVVEEAPKFEWDSSKEDQEIYRHGKRFLLVLGRPKAIQKFVEALSYKIGHKCDFSYIAGRAHIDVLPDGYEKALEAIKDKEFMNQFIVPFSIESYDNETYFVID